MTWTTVTHQSGEVTSFSAADTAKLVRARLKKVFPGQKFSVRSSNYSMGASIDVRWTDGPTEGQVDAEIKQYAGARFDGMIDLKYHAEHWLLPDGTAMVRREYGHSYSEAEVHNEDQEVPEGAKKVHFQADYVHGQRSLSAEYRAELEARIVKDWGSMERAEEQTREWSTTLIWREASKDTGRYALEQAEGRSKKPNEGRF